MKSTEELIDESRFYANTFYDSSVTSTPRLLRELADRLEELSKERAEMVQAFRFFREVHLSTGLTLRCAAVLLGISPVTLSKWTATEPTTEPDFVD
jgi:hypothetical protein